MKKIILPLVRSFDDLDAFAKLKVDHVSWEEFPYCPPTEVRAAHAADRLLVRFDVAEELCRAVATEYMGHVWEDSCVEFFLKSPDSGFYYNFETNCIGTGLSARRRSRNDSTPLPEQAVVRRSSLPHAVIDPARQLSYSVELEIPFASLDCGPHPETLLGNFYKCGDKTGKPHFLSWNPVDTPSPDFHRPEFFGMLSLEW